MNVSPGGGKRKKKDPIQDAIQAAMDAAAAGVQNAQSAAVSTAINNAVSNTVSAAKDTIETTKEEVKKIAPDFQPKKNLLKLPTVNTMQRASLNTVKAAAVGMKNAFQSDNAVLNKLIEKSNELEYTDPKFIEIMGGAKSAIDRNPVKDATTTEWYQRLQQNERMIQDVDSKIRDIDYQTTRLDTVDELEKTAKEDPNFLTIASGQKYPTKSHDTEDFYKINSFDVNNKVEFANKYYGELAMSGSPNISNLGYYFTYGGNLNNALKYKTMTDEQRDVYAYWLAKDYKKAEEYLENIDWDLNEKYAQDFTEKVKNLSSENPAYGLAANVGSSLGAGTAYLGNAAQMVENAATGSYKPTDPNSPSMLLPQVTKASQEGLTGGIENPALKFLADTGLSILQNAARMPAGPGLSLLLAGTSAAGSTTQDALSRGATPEQALGLSTAAGLIEFATEKIPTDKFFDLLKGGSKPLSAAMTDVLKQAGIEGTEELVSEYANRAVDNIVMGDKSEMEQYIKELMAQGMTREQAEKEARTEFWVKQPLLSAAGGALSGGVMGGAGTVGGAVNTKIAQNQETKLQREQNQAQLYESAVNNNVPQEQADTISELAKDINTKVVFDSNTDANGYYENGTIHLSPDAENVPVVFGHELTHSLEGTKAYEQLVDHISQSVDIAAESQRKIQEYAERGITLDQKAAEAEAVTEYVTENLLTDEAAIQRIANDDRTLAGKIRTFFDKTAAKVTGNAEKAYLVEAERLYAKALKQAQKGTQPTEMRYSVKPENQIETKEADANKVVGNQAETQAGQVMESQPMEADASKVVGNQAQTQAGQVTAEQMAQPVESVEAVPMQQTTEKKVSKVRTNTYENARTVFEKADIAAQEMAKEGFQYDVKTERESMRQAQERIDTDYEGEVERLPEMESWSSVDLDTAMEILRRKNAEARETGDYKDAANWANIIQKKGTQAGQMIQAFAKYSRTPEGVMTNAADVLQNLVDDGKLSEAQMNDTLQKMSEFSETLDVIEEGDTQSLVDLIIKQAEQRRTKVSRGTVKRLNSEKDFQYLYDFALTQMENIALDYQPNSLGKKISTAQAMSHLLNVRTALRNVVSNQVFDIVDSTANNLSLIPDAILSIFTKQRTVGFEKSWLAKGKRQGAAEGKRRGALEISLDVAPKSSDQKSKYGTGKRRTFKANSKNPIGRTLSTLEKAMGYELNVTDEFHKGSVRGEVLESLQGFIEKGYLTEEQAMEIAEQEALYRSFQDNTVPGAILAGLKDTLNLVGIGDSGRTLKGLQIKEFGLGDLIQKYTQVPGALISRAVEFSPAGYVKAIAALASAGKKSNNMELAGNSRLTFEAQRKAALAMGRATTGTGLIVAFAALAASGLLRRSEDEENKDVAALNSAEGIGGTQLNISGIARWLSGGAPEWQAGDVTIDVSFMEPLNAIMTLGALVAQDNTDRGFFAKLADNTLESLFMAIKDTPTMQTMDSLYNTIQYHDDETDLPLWGEIPITIAESSITGFVPSVVRQIAQATDQNYRDQYSSTDPFQQIVDKVKNTIPGLRQTLPEKLDNFGNPKTYSNPWLNALNATLFPGNMNIYTQSEVSKELQEVRKATGRDDIYPERNAPYSLKFGENKVELTPEERETFQKTRGNMIDSAIADLMQSETYKGSTAEEKAQLIADAVDFGNDMAKRELAETRGLEYTNTTWDKTIEAMESGVSFGDYRLWKSQTSGMKNQEKREILQQQNLTDEQKIALYEIDISDTRADDIQQFMDAGLSFNQFLQAQNAYSSINEEDLKATQKAAKFSQWVDAQGYEGEENQLVKDIFTYYSMSPVESIKYDDFTSVGLKEDVATDLSDILLSLKPEEGKDQVSYYQKYNAIVNTKYSDEEKMAALGVVMPEETFAKLQRAYSEGASVQGYTAALEAISKTEPDAGKTSLSDSKKYYVVGNMDFSEEEKRAILYGMMSQERFDKFDTAYNAGISVQQYTDYLYSISAIESDKDEEGKTVKNSLKEKVLTYIDRLDLTTDQKDILYFDKGYTESTLDDAPWYGGASYDGPLWEGDTGETVRNGNPEGSPTKEETEVVKDQLSRITQAYGEDHSGVDIGYKDSPNDPINSISDGRVVWVQTGYGNTPGATGNASYGNAVKIQNADGTYSIYGHLNNVNVKEGDTVTAGQQIGNMGNTGNSYGTHLHFEMRDSNDNNIDPMPYLNGGVVLGEGTYPDAVVSGNTYGSSSAGSSGSSSKKPSGSSSNLSFFPSLGKGEITNTSFSSPGLTLPRASKTAGNLTRKFSAAATTGLSLPTAKRITRSQGQTNKVNTSSGIQSRNSSTAKAKFIKL
jgi:murein DD-endopeptidase MepM/ murein hydrolase activator NlpD